MASAGLGLTGGAIALGVALVLVGSRLAADANLYTYWVDIPLPFFALGILQVTAFGVVLMLMAIRRSDEVRAAAIWGVSLPLSLQGVSHGLAMDVVGVWLFYAGSVGLASALIATVESPRRVRVMPLGIAAVALGYSLVWVLTRLTSSIPPG